MFEYDYGPEFEEALIKAMLGDENSEPCCEMFGKSLHHHWQVSDDV